MAISPYAAADPSKLAEIIRQAEARLEVQLTVTLGADQRAMTFAGLLLAAAAALLGVAFGTSSPGSLSNASVAISAGLVVAAAFACWSASPTSWECVGNEPSQWLDDIASGDSLHNGIATMADHYDEMIKANEGAIGTAALRMRISMIVALVSMVAGLAVVALTGA